MAYMNQELKKELAVGIKKAMPKDWKYSLGVHNHSTLVCTIWSAPEPDVPTIEAGTNTTINEYSIESHFSQYPELCKNLMAISDAMNNGNWDKSDSMSDYFNVGWYTTIRFGRWDKPFAYN